MLGVGAVSLSHTLPCAHMPLPQCFLALVVLNQIKIFVPRKKKDDDLSDCSLSNFLTETKLPKENSTTMDKKNVKTVCYSRKMTKFNVHILCTSQFDTIK